MHASPILITNTGAPQGCVLSPFLYTTYTTDCRCDNPDCCSCVKFAGDSAIVGLLSDDSSCLDYRGTVDNVSLRSSQRCDTNFRELHLSMTKEIVIDPRRGDHRVELVKVNGQSAKVVGSFKYLGLFDSITLLSEVRSCVKVEVAVLGSRSLIVLTVSVNVKQH